MKKLHYVIVAALLVMFSTSSVTLALNDKPRENEKTETVGEALQTVYRFIPDTEDDWTNPSLWEPGFADICGGLNVPCQVDLVAAGYSSIEEMLLDFEEEDLQEFLDHPGVDAKL